MTPAQHRIAGRTAMAVALSLSMFTVSSAVGAEGPVVAIQKLWVEVDNVTFY